MAKKNLVPVKHIVKHYRAELSFVHQLNDYGLIQLTTVEKDFFVKEEEIKSIEQMIHLHYDLDINIEGIDAIQHLMNRINDLHNETIRLRNRLSAYEY